MSINPQDEAYKTILSLEKRLVAFLSEETHLKMSVQKLESVRDKALAYDRLKRVQDAIFKHQTYLVNVYYKLQPSTPSEPDEDERPFGIGDIMVTDVPTP